MPCAIQTPLRFAITIDDDCDKKLIDLDDDDLQDASAYYLDADGDGYGSTELIAMSCTPLDGVTNSLDCDDSNVLVYRNCSRGLRCLRQRL